MIASSSARTRAAGDRRVTPRTTRPREIVDSPVMVRASTGAGRLSRFVMITAPVMLLVAPRTNPSAAGAGGDDPLGWQELSDPPAQDGLRLDRRSGSGHWALSPEVAAGSTVLVEPQSAPGTLRQLVPQGRTRHVPDDRRDLPGQVLVRPCLLGGRAKRDPHVYPRLLGGRAQRDLHAAAGENVVPGSSGPGTATQRAQPADSRLGGPDRGGPADGAVPGQRQLQRAPASPVVVQRDDRCAAKRLGPAQAPAGGQRPDAHHFGSR